MENGTKEHCPHCGQAMTVHKYTLTKSLGNALVKIHKAVGEGLFNAFDLGKSGVLNQSDMTNISHLRYLSLVEKVKDEEINIRGKKNHRLWRISENGLHVIRGGKTIAWVKVFNRKVIEFANESIGLKDALGFYEPPEVWAQRAENLHKDDLFAV